MVRTHLHDQFSLEIGKSNDAKQLAILSKSEIIMIPDLDLVATLTNFSGSQ